MNPLFEKLDRLGLKPLYDPNELPAVGPAYVNELESSFGYPFPPFYKEFLLRYGLSIFDGYASFDVPPNWEDVTPTKVGIFYGLVSEHESDARTLDGVIRWRSKRLPTYFYRLANRTNYQPLSIFHAAKKITDTYTLYPAPRFGTSKARNCLPKTHFISPLLLNHF